MGRSDCPANLEQVRVVLLLLGGGCVSTCVTEEDLGNEVHGLRPEQRREVLVALQLARPMARYLPHDDAIDKTFRGALREAQGVFAIHEHGGVGRPSHPHVHALLSPRFQNRMAVHISPARIQRLKERWEREVLVGLQRQERRLRRMRQLVPPLPGHARERDDRVPFQVLPRRPGVRWTNQLELFSPAERAVRLAHGGVRARRWLRLGRRGSFWARDPEKAARRAVFRLASKAMPRSIREVLRALRGVRAFSLRQR